MAERNLPPARHEASDVALRPILVGLVLTGIVLIGLAALALWMYPSSLTDRTIALPLQRFPKPQLQPDPPAEMQAFLAQELKVLNGVGWLDQAHGVVHIPIEQAMQDVARRGIPDWPRETSP
jgi:hypothetical protein